ncbi:MAG: N-6 DNA methylase [candidate division WOR-3 bacterium]
MKEDLFSLADKLVEETKKLLRQTKNEEDLRIGFEKILEPIKKSLNLKYFTQYEKSIYTGRPDAVHGKLIIEYEHPNAFRSKKAIDNAFEQLVKYIKGFSEEEKKELFIYEAKYIGVGFDGYKIFFVRYRGKKERPKIELDEKDFIIEGPYDFNLETAKTFLIHLRGLSRIPLTADNLSKKFGEKGIAADVIPAFLNALKHWGNQTKTKTYFDEWKRLFGIVYGEGFNSSYGKGIDRFYQIYTIRKDFNFQEILFSIHTYFTFLMKLLTAEILTLRESSFSSSFVSRLINLSDEELKRELAEIEDGSIYAQKGITNFLEGDFFCWYLSALDSPELKDAIREILRGLEEFEPATNIIEPDLTRDLLKKLYQYLVPKEIRHNLGEYYTPDWLAELVLEEVGYDGNIDKRLLDPACGSGTFLVLAIQRAIKYGKEKDYPNIEIIKRILNNIWGFDLNPLAVISCRTNYLLSLGELVNEYIDKGGNIEIPVYLCDSVLWPERIGTNYNLSFGEITIKTSIKEFHIPAVWIKNPEYIKTAASLIERDVKNQIEPKIAMEHFKKAGILFKPNEKIIENFYKEILDLEKENKNGIWARFLKNAFAPMIAGKFDFLVGNPPWIRWDYLSEEYRNATLQLWKEYGLFSLKGFQTRLGGGKKDFSMLFTYASCDNYLNNNGKLGFLITQEVFKSKGAGEGFRRFQIGDKEYLKVIKAHDLVAIKPFEGAANKTAMIILKKGEKTKYPLPYFVWTRKKRVSKIPTDKLLDEVLDSLDRKKLIAKPIKTNVGAWQTQSAELEKLSGIKGKNYYKAILGANPNPYGVFWLKIKQILSNGDLIIRNLTEEGKLKIQQVEERIEQNLVYPAIRGADIERWKVKPQIFMLVVQNPKTRRGYPEDFMQKNYPRTYNYLLKFKDILLNRPLYKKYHKQVNAPFYSQFNISEETFARYKVVWKRMTNDLIAVVISQLKTPFGFKTAISLETTAFIPTNNESEAHYLCAIINSNPVREFVKSFSSPGRGFGTPLVMEHIGIPKFDPNNEIHKQISYLSKECHKLKEEGKDKEIEKLEKEIDLLVKKLFNII